jgi:hypothetical protein
MVTTPRAVDVDKVVSVSVQVVEELCETWV